MSAVQRVEHVHVIELRLVIPGLTPVVTQSPERLKVYEEPQGVPEPAPMQTMVSAVPEVRSLVDLYQDLLSNRDAERRVSEKTIRDNLSVLKRFQSWSETAGKLGDQHPVRLLDEAAERSPEVLIPLSTEMRDLIERFRGIDSERVFPTANNSRTYSEEFIRILNRAGLSDESRAAAGEPIIRPSLGQRGVASFRKGCATYWSELVGPQAASYLLHHYVPAEGVAKMTTENYLQHEGILRKIVGKIEDLSGLVS